jgi:hypothetical protein
MHQMLQPFMDFGLELRFHEQQQKPPAAGAKDLSSHGTHPHGFVIQMVDFRRGDPIGKATLTEPALMT